MPITKTVEEELKAARETIADLEDELDSLEERLSDAKDNADAADRDANEARMTAPRKAVETWLIRQVGFGFISPEGRATVERLLSDLA